MNVDVQLLTNGAYGFPRGAPRRLTPYVLAVVHQTSNATADAQGERNYANRVGSGGPSATYYVNKDGSVIQAVADNYASWCAGDVRSPDTSIPTVARMVADRARLADWVPLMNANEAVWDQYECCGDGPEPWTDAQFESVAALIAQRARATGLPIDRTTVLAHRDVNTVDRASDPWPDDRREDRMARLIGRANELLGGGAVQSQRIVIELFGEGPRAWSVVAGQAVRAFDAARPGAAVASETFTAPATFHADAKVWIEYGGVDPWPVPSGGPFLRVVDGPFKGLLVVASQVVVADPPPVGGTATPDPRLPAVEQLVGALKELLG